MNEQRQEKNTHKVSSVSNHTVELYKFYTRKRILFLLGIAIITFIIAILSLNLGASDLGPISILRLLIKPDTSWNSSVIWNLRLPRILAAIFAGGSLGLAGMIMQTILRNPLASPFTLGISNAAAFGAAFAIVVLGGGKMIGSSVVVSQISNPTLVTICAFCSALFATGIILLLTRIRGFSSETIVLGGLAISSLFSTGLALLTWFADDVAIASIVFWQFGSLSKANWTILAYIFVILSISFVCFMLFRWDYNTLSAGEEVSKGLGVNIKLLSLISLILSALLTACVVSFFGIIGFVGLLGPHLARQILGSDHRFIIPGSFCIGGFVLLISHIIGSYLFSISIPVGIVSSALGGPLFFAIIFKKGRA